MAERINREDNKQPRSQAASIRAKRPATTGVRVATSKDQGDGHQGDLVRHEGCTESNG